MVDANQLPPKLYRKLLSTIYQQTQKDAKTIKDNFSRNSNPLCQKEARCLSVKSRRHNLTQEYNKKMEEKPEKIHKKIFNVKNNFDKNLSVISNEPCNRSIKIFRNVRKNQASMSAPKIERHKKFISLKDNYKNFYLDNFNSIKQNQNDIDDKNKVRIFLFIFLMLNKQLKYRNKQREKNFISGISDYKLILEDPRGFKRPSQNTKEDIFPENNKKVSIKVNRNDKLTRKKMYSKAYGDKIGSIISQKDDKQIRKKDNLKPCNNNYKLISKEARKNAGVRYYYEKNSSQFNLI